MMHTVKESTSSRFNMLLLIAATVALGACWLWARLHISYLQQSNGIGNLGILPDGPSYEFWALSLPSYVAGIGLVVSFGIAAVCLVWRRRLADVPALVGCSGLLFCADVVLFASLGFEAFD